MLGQDVKHIPAVPPGLTHHYNAPTFHVLIIRRPLITESHTPSRILKVPENSFPLALRSPFGFMFFAAITLSATLCRKRGETYLLFFNGLTHYNTTVSACQEVLQKNLHFSENLILGKYKYGVSLTDYAVFTSRNCPLPLAQRASCRMLIRQKAKVFQTISNKPHRANPNRLRC